MSRDLRHPLLLAAALALGTACLPAAEDAPSLVGTASGITFAGYDKDASGRRIFLLSADKAAPKDAPRTKNLWMLERVKIRAFDKTGEDMAVLSAPSAEYASDARTARDPGPVAMTGKLLSLAGRDWVWVNATSNKHDITLGADVRVVITPAPEPGKKSKPAVVITARNLHALMDTEGTRLEFTGNVRVEQGDTVVTCEKLSTYAQGGSGKVFSVKKGEMPVDRIDAEGGVTLTGRGARITGRNAVILPKDGTYAVNGDAEFTEIKDGRIKIGGESMVLKTDPKNHADKSGVITVTPRVDAADGRVIAELPPFDPETKPTLRAHASGRNLTIVITPKGNEVRLDGDVHLVDPVYTGSCENLVIETAPMDGPDKLALSPTDQKSDALRRVVADKSVTLSRDGRTMRCDHAEIVTVTKSESRVTLTGSPTAEDAKTGATMSASRMTLVRNREKDTNDLTATGEPGSPVRVEIPALRQSGAKGMTPGRTKIESERAVASHRTLPRNKARGGIRDMGLFEFEGSVKLTGDRLDGSCERLGVEVANYDTDIRRLRNRVNRIVAVGFVKLRQEGYTAEAGRAEIIPGAKLAELTISDDHGLDGDAPFHVTLTQDESTPGVRPKTGVAGLTLPTPGADGTASIRNEDDKEPGVTTVESDFQELIQGEERLRAFAHGAVKLEGKDLEGEADGVELLALKTLPEGKPEAPKEFALNTLVARGGVRLQFLDAKTGRKNRAAADTFEISPGAGNKVVTRDHGVLTLTGHPVLDGWPSVAGSERKIMRWNTVKDAGGKPRTELKLKDETSKGMPSQIIRPRLIIPVEGAPDLGRSLKSLDKNP